MQVAVRIEQQPLALERARHRPLVAVGDHVRVVQVHERLAAQHGFFLHAIEEELPHEGFFALAEADRLLQLLVVEHRVGEPQHVEHDVEVLRARPGEDVLGVRHVGGEDRRGDSELEIRRAAWRAPASLRWSALAFSKPFFTSRTWLCTSPMPSSETRMLIRMPLLAQNSTIRVSIGMARCGVSPVVLMPILRSRGRCRWNISTISGRSLRVVGSPPEMLRFSTAPQNGLSSTGSSSRERHVGLAVAPLPVVAHRAAGVADPGAVIDEHGRADGVELRADEGIDEVARDTSGRFGEVVQSERRGGHQGNLLMIPRRSRTVKALVHRELSERAVEAEGAGNAARQDSPETIGATVSGEPRKSVSRARPGVVVAKSRRCARSFRERLPR